MNDESLRYVVGMGLGAIGMLVAGCVLLLVGFSAFALITLVVSFAFVIQNAWWLTHPL